PRPLASPPAHFLPCRSASPAHFPLPRHPHVLPRLVPAPIRRRRIDPHTAEPPDRRLHGEPVGHTTQHLAAGLRNRETIVERTIRIERRSFVDRRLRTSHLVEDVQEHRVAEKR